ncbi:hypothetical protein OESDEN_24282 [Oesophagostomum dentatum]|uniref:ADP/ATP translocase n=1 Tax=Oesophagostomum dentatum TaxID=61180 RepID=A0A0B1RTV7_OESDE|nr:hypothetical protein OESDEN_24282 [Oesophagostomum dentatum]
MTDCLKRVTTEQGVLSLWRGNTAGVVRCFPNHALNFALRDLYRNLLLKDVDRRKEFWRFAMGRFTVHYSSTTENMGMVSRFETNADIKHLLEDSSIFRY